MRFTIHESFRVYRRAATKDMPDVIASALDNCQRGVEKKRQQWCSLGASILSEPRSHYYDVLEDYNASGVSVGQHLDIPFFALLHAVRQGKVKISERKYDKYEEEWYRTFSLTGGYDD